MQIVANGIGIEVDDQGPAGAEPLLLIMGLGMQLIGWPDELVQMLVARGFRVIRLDNRDAGLSQGFDHLGVPNLALAALQHTLHIGVRAPYRVADMAADALGVLDALGVQRAHVCGASMGGMIAQHLAVRHPQRLASLTLMMTGSGSRRLPQPGWKVQAAMLSRPKDPRSLDSVIEHGVRIYKLIGSPGFPLSDDYLHERVGLGVRRSYRPAAVARQLVAIAADGDRTPLLASVRAPTQILHGLQDPLVPVEAGRELARRIDGARIDLIEGMGHDLPPPLWPRFVEGIVAAAGRA